MKGILALVAVALAGVSATGSSSPAAMVGHGGYGSFMSAPMLADDSSFMHMSAPLESKPLAYGFGSGKWTGELGAISKPWLGHGEARTKRVGRKLKRKLRRGKIMKAAKLMGEKEEFGNSNFKETKPIKLSDESKKFVDEEKKESELLDDEKPESLPITSPTTSKWTGESSLPLTSTTDWASGGFVPVTKPVWSGFGYSSIRAPLLQPTQTLPVLDLNPIMETYAVPSTTYSIENIKQPITQPVIQPILQRFVRQAQPILQPVVNRVVQPIVHRQLQPFLQTKHEVAADLYTKILPTQFTTTHNQPIVGADYAKKPMFHHPTASFSSL